MPKRQGGRRRPQTSAPKRGCFGMTLRSSTSGRATAEASVESQDCGQQRQDQVYLRSSLRCTRRSVSVSALPASATVEPQDYTQQQQEQDCLRSSLRCTIRSVSAAALPASATVEPQDYTQHQQGQDCLRSSLRCTIRSVSASALPASATVEPQDYAQQQQDQDSLRLSLSCTRSSVSASELPEEQQSPEQQFLRMTLRPNTTRIATLQESVLPQDTLVHCHDQQHLHQQNQEQECSPAIAQPADNCKRIAQPARRMRRRNELLSIARYADVTAFNEQALPEEMAMSHCGSLFDTKCPHCNAFRWPTELASFCCEKGTVVLDHVRPPPNTLRMMHDDSAYRSSYLNNTRAYNNTLALASLGCKQPPNSGFNPTFKIQGKMYHCIGSLLPVDGAMPKFAQLYFHDSDNEVQNRLNHAPHLEAPIIHQLQDMLHEVNSYIKSFRAAAELTSHHNVQVVLHGDKALKPSGEHCRKYNLPMQSEVAALVHGETASNLDVAVHARDGRLQRIPITHRAYDPLHYVLLFPFGEDGWQLGLKRTNNRTLTASDFYCYRLQVRDGDYNLLMKSRRFMQQYAVDEWARIEFCRMQWVRNNQKAIRAEKYKGLHDAVVDSESVNAGRKIILPPTIYGSPRFYSEAFMNAMTIVRHMGKPDYFITITTNPRWPEIVEALHEGEQPQDRPDLCARVFKLKLLSLMDDLLKKHILGHVQAYVYTIEWQKRGLTHCHILLIMTNAYKPKTPEMIDTAVSAELPDKDTNLELFKMVTKHMLHGPCGHVNPNAPCMEQKGVQKVCTKGFPKRFTHTTTIPEDSYPQYRRRSPANGGQTCSTKIRGHEVHIDNSCVVPYNPLLLLRYRAHVNVEVVHSVQAVKYLYKYITKGQDRVILSMQAADGDETAHDEVETYLNSWYISASEAFWRIYGFEIHKKYPAVEKLPCHLPGEQVVIFAEGQAADVAQRGPPVTKLMAHFETNKTDTMARSIYYPDFPRYFTWNNKTKSWQRRKSGSTSSCGDGQVVGDTLGRIPTISLSPHQSELYYLRMLLHNKAGAQSYEDLRTIDGGLCPTFQDACRCMGLLEDDSERDAAMTEAASIRFGSHLRDLFANILIHCKPTHPLQFYERHRLELCRDIMLREGASKPTEAMTLRCHTGARPVGT